MRPAPAVGPPAIPPPPCRPRRSPRRRRWTRCSTGWRPCTEADLERREQELVKQIRLKMGKQTERLNRLGIGPAPATSSVTPDANVAVPTPNTPHRP